MNKILLFLLLILPQVASATLTVNNVPVTKTGGSNPVLQNSDITDVPGVSVAIGVPTTVNGSSVLTSIIADSPLSGNGTSASHLIFTNPGYITGNQNITLTGYVTGSGTTAIATSMPTINSNVGTFTNSTLTVNAQGQVTAASTGSAGGSSLTKATFTNSSLTNGVLTVVHNLSLSNSAVLFSVFNNSNSQIIPDSIVTDASSVTVTLTSFGTLSGTWRYAYLAQ